MYTVVYRASQNVNPFSVNVACHMLIYFCADTDGVACHMKSIIAYLKLKSLRYAPRLFHFLWTLHCVFFLNFHTQRHICKNAYKKYSSYFLYLFFTQVSNKIIWNKWFQYFFMAKKDWNAVASKSFSKSFFYAFLIILFLLIFILIISKQ